ncbi:MAG: hypothetical protein GY702_25090 [Desulfobulbaceae bacterium]|nr:hypothetical protein [Desulfobulbaceae bacterium]
MRLGTRLFATFLFTTLFMMLSSVYAAEYSVTAFNDEGVNEENGTVTLTVMLDQLVASGDTVVFDISAAPVSPGSIADYGVVPTTLQILEGVQSGEVVIPIINDTLVELPESFEVTLSEAATSATVTNAPQTATVTITSEDKYKIVLSSDFSLDVDDSPAEVDINVDGSTSVQAGHQVVLNYNSIDGTAFAGTDYNNISGSLSLPDNNAKPVSIALISGRTRSGDKTFDLKVDGFQVDFGAGPIPGYAEAVDDTSSITIKDHNFTITPVETSALEDALVIEFEISLDRDPVGSESVSVEYAISAGTATEDVDYSSIPSDTLTFTSVTGKTQKVSISLIDDTDVEPDETITLILSNPSTSAVLNGSSVTGTIIDDDYTFSPTTSAVDVNEDVGTLEITINLDAPAADDNEVFFNVVVEDGTTEAGKDYSAPSGTLTILKGMSSGTVSIPIINDTLVEPDETFEVKISSASSNISTAEQVVDVTIKVDDKYKVAITGDVEVDADDGEATLNVRVVEPTVESGHKVTVQYDANDGVAVAGDDYDDISDTLELTDNSPSEIKVTINNDGEQTGAEAFTVDLSGLVTVPTDSSGPLAYFSDDSATITINDHEFTANFVSDESASEDSGSLVFRVELDRQPVDSEVVTIKYKTVEGTATATSDYTPITEGTLTFNKDKDAVQNVSVTLVDDDVMENAEQFTVELFGASTNVYLENGEAIGTITDDDYIVETFADITVDESVGDAKLKVTLNTEVRDGDSVKFKVTYQDGTAIEGSDFTAPSVTLVIPQDQKSGTISIPITNDNLVEFVEDFTIKIEPDSGNVTVVDDTAQVTINVDEQYTFSIDNVTQHENIADMTFTVTLTNPAPIQVDHNGLQLLANTINGTATAPADFTALVDEPITFSDAADEQPVTVTIIADAEDEGAGENFTVQLAAAPAFASIVTFTDNPGLGVIQDTDYTVTPSWNDGGAVSLDVETILNGTPVGIDSGSPAVFTVKADYEIKSVLIDGATSQPYVTIDNPTDLLNRKYTFDFGGATPPPGNFTFEVVFNHQIIMSASAGGVIEYTADNTTVTEGQLDVIVEDGTDASFEFTSDSGNCVVDVTVDGTSLGAFGSLADNWDSNTYTFNSVVKDHTIDVSFDNVAITIEMDVNDGKVDSDADLLIQSSSSSAGWRAYKTDASFNYDEVTDLIKSGKHGDTISIPGDTTTCDSSFFVIQFLELDGYLKPDAININVSDSFENKTYLGSYDKDSYILTIVTENGSVIREPEGTEATGTNRFFYSANEIVTLEAVPDADWFFQSWTQDVSGTVKIVTIKMDGDKIVEPQFIQGCDDNDGDGYRTDIGTDCTTTGPVDCDDTNPNIHPGKVEICGDGINQNCSELNDEGVDEDDICKGDDKDDDGDGYTEKQGDCDDEKASVAPGLYDDPTTTDVNEDCYDGPKKEGDNLVCEEFTVGSNDAPANVAKTPADPMLIFLFDDSGSMAWEFMTREYNGIFDYNYYLDNHPDEAKVNGSYLNSAERRYWASQFSEYSRIYFNPTTTYTPWPKWDEVAADASYASNEKGTVRTTENSYGGNAAFPASAFVDGYVHADMDSPRYNTIDSDDGHSWSYKENNGKGMTYELNKTYMTVKLAGSSQKMIVSRDVHSAGTSTLSDAIGLSKIDLGTITTSTPGIVLDGVAGGTFEDFYEESGTWHPSNSSSPWNNYARYTQNNGDSAINIIDLTADQADDYYVYAWVNSYDQRDPNARYDVFYYDSDTLVSDTIRVIQNPYDAGSSTWGARWVRIGDKAYSFKEQSSTDITTVNIPAAHYYTWNDADGDDKFDFNDLNNNGLFDHKTEAALEEIYLVTIPGSGRTNTSYSLKYYLFIDLNNDAKVQDGELTEVTGDDIPTAIKPEVKDEAGDYITDETQRAYVVRQNFADWFAFYRTRMQTAKAAVGLTVVDMENVEIGIHTINRSTVFRPVKVNNSTSTEMLQFLSSLYDIDPSGSTPLRRGLNEVGYYYDGSKCTDSSNLEDDYFICTDEDYTTKVTCEAASETWQWIEDCTSSETVFSNQEEGGECQKAYVVAMTDGYYNGSFNFSYDSGEDLSLENSKNKDTLSTYTVLQDGSDNSFADIAYYYYEKDLDQALGDKLPTKGYDDKTSQHMVTYAVSFGVFGWFDPDLFPQCLPEGTPGEDSLPLLSDIGTATFNIGSGKITYTDGAGPFTNKCPDWHNTVQINNAYSVDDLFHGSVNSRGKFLNAADPADLVKSMKAIKDLIDSDRGTASSVAVNANKIQDDTLLYQTIYDSDSWSGDVLAKCLDSNGAVASCERVTCEATCNDEFTTCMSSCGIGGNECEDICVEEITTCVEIAKCDELTNTDDSIVLWSADEELDSVTVDYSTGTDQRSIITSKIISASGVTKAEGIAFTWSAIDSGMQTILDGDNDGIGDEELLQYLRGDSRYEVENDTAGKFNFRDRESKLGDFINSEPYHYKNDDLDIDWVFAGANDGMLHVFEARTGKEVFAYIPRIVFDNLPDFADSSLTGQHTFFVDGYLTVKKLGNAVVLIGGLGKGGKGFFCLNITAAATYKDSIESHAEEVVLWEYSTATVDSSYAADLGYSFSRPQIINTNVSGLDYLFVFGNGYNSENGKAVLFLVGLDSDGKRVSTKIIDTGVGCPDSVACSGLTCSETTGPAYNGLSTPAVIFPQGDGNDDFIFAGDLLGNLWKFDISSSTVTDWDSYFKDGTTAKPLFSAQNVSGYQQPITMQPDVTYSCTSSQDGYLVTFGTGRLLDKDDPKNMSIQSVYGIWDWSKAWLNAGVALADVKKSNLGIFEAGETGIGATCKAICQENYDNSTGISECKTANKLSYCSVDRTTCITSCSGDTDCIDHYCSPMDEALCQTECGGDVDCINTYCASGSAIDCEIACAGDTDCSDKYCSSWDTDVCETTVDSICEETESIGTCIDDCKGNTECKQDCLVAFNSCTSNCDTVRKISNVETVIGNTTAAKYITLLQQTQVYAGGIKYNSDGTINKQVYGVTDLDAYDEIVRTMSDNEIDWFDPSQKDEFISDPAKTVKHVGWYFDLPANGERVVRDMTIINGKLVYTSSVPTDSPCESGGRSSHWSVDVCSGGRTNTPFLDLNDDGVINSKDYINIGTEANPIWAPTSSIQVDGLAPSPTIVEIENQLDRLYFPDEREDDSLNDSSIQGFGTPIQYWRELNWQ